MDVQTLSEIQRDMESTQLDPKTPYEDSNIALSTTDSREKTAYEKYVLDPLKFKVDLSDFWISNFNNERYSTEKKRIKGEPDFLVRNLKYAYKHKFNFGTDKFDLLAPNEIWDQLYLSKDIKRMPSWTTAFALEKGNFWNGLISILQYQIENEPIKVLPAGYELRQFHYVIPYCFDESNKHPFSKGCDLYTKTKLHPTYSVSAFHCLAFLDRLNIMQGHDCFKIFDMIIENSGMKLKRRSNINFGPNLIVEEVDNINVPQVRTVSIYWFVNVRNLDFDEINGSDWLTDSEGFSKTITSNRDIETLLIVKKLGGLKNLISCPFTSLITREYMGHKGDNIEDEYLIRQKICMTPIIVQPSFEMIFQRLGFNPKTKGLITQLFNENPFYTTSASISMGVVLSLYMKSLELEEVVEDDSVLR
jgi:hypothetical protein